MDQPTAFRLQPLVAANLPPVARVAWFESLLPAIRRLPAARGRITRLILERLLPSRGRVAVPLAAGFDLTGSPLSMVTVMHVMAQRGWDDHVLHICLDALQPGGVLYDIGANAGYISLAAAQARRSAKVIAFEPLPALAEDVALAAQLGGFDHLSVYNVALSAENGEAELFLPTQSVHASFVSREEGATRVKVPTVRLDDAVAAGILPPPTVIKLDVEGAEMLVLDGAAETLRTHRPLICFECDLNAERFGHTPGSFMGRLRALGYTRFEAAAPDGTRTPLDEAAQARAGWGDFVASA
jgi:FkbM family methyltransferase